MKSKAKQKPKDHSDSDAINVTETTSKATQLSEQEAARLGLNEDNGLPWLNANIKRLLIDNEIDEINDAVLSGDVGGLWPKTITSCLVRIRWDKDGVTTTEVLEASDE
jgi:hypothetical protein